MNVLRNRFLNTTALLLDPREPTGDASGDQPDADAGNDDASDDADASAESGADAGDVDDDAGGDADADADADGDDDGDSDEDDDPDLADLPPEAKAKAKAAIARRVAKETGWRDKQIDRLHAKRRAAEDEVAAAATIVGRTPAAAAGDDPSRKFTSEEVKAEAARMAAQTQYDKDCDAAFQQGNKVFGTKWNGALAKLPKLGGVDVTDMVDILATDKPHVVLYQMADPEVYERVMALPPARRRTEFVKLSLKPEPKPKQAESRRPSDAVAPVRPLNGSRRVAAQAVDLHDDKVADDKWYEARNATRRKKFSNAG